MMQAEEEEKNRDDFSVDSDGSDEEDDDLDSNGTKGKATEGGDADGEREHPRKKHVWYYKIEAFINHVREMNYDLIHVLGTCLYLDEMMICFVGRSVETHHTKNKPIGEGYKFFALTTTN
eukprot:4555284-Ditylum_brightwellii.AAC.1